MHHFVSNIQQQEAVALQQYIDNCNGNMKVGIKSITFWFGLYNIKQEEVIQYHKTVKRTRIIEPGYYSFNQLSGILTNMGANIKINKANGKITLIIPPGEYLLISDSIKSMLGLESKDIYDEGTFVSEKPVNFVPTTSLYIHLEQINTTENFINGRPSTLLGVLPIPAKAFGEAITINFQHPEFRNLEAGTISELKLQVRDDNNKTINNNNFPINILLEFIK